MRLSVDNVTGRYTNNLSQTVKTNKYDTKESKGKNFDEILISGGKKEAESKISKEISEKAIYEMSFHTSEERISELRNAIEQGTYEVDVQKLATRILG